MTAIDYQRRLMDRTVLANLLRRASRTERNLAEALTVQDL
jgi:hypothetical protein